MFGIKLGFFVGAVISILMLYRVLRKELTFDAFFMHSVGVIMTSIMFFAFSGWLIKAQYVYIGYPSYDATVVETGRYLDEDYETGTTSWMYKPTFKFEVAGHYVEVERQGSTSTKVVVGEHQLVFYKDGYLLPFDIQEILLNLMMLIMLFLAPFYFVTIFLNSLKLDSDAFADFGFFYFGLVAFPAFLAIFVIIISNHLWKVFIGVESLSHAGILVHILMVMALLTGIFEVYRYAGVYFRKKRKR